MRLRSLRVMVLAVFLLNSCEGQPAATPSPTPFEFVGSPRDLVLRDADVPPGYHVRLERTVGVFEVAQFLSTDTASSSGAANELVKRGFRSAYVRSFDGASKHEGIASVVILFRDAASAHDAVSFLAGSAHDLGCPELPVPITIGDISKACGGDLVYEDDTNGSVIYLYFASANALAYIGMAGDPHANLGVTVGLLALEQLRLMWSGGAELKGR